MPRRRLDLRPGPRAWRLPVRNLVMFACLAGVALAFLLVLGDGFRAGGALIALVCGGAAVARAVLPSEWSGTLAVRGKWVDVAVLATLALAIGLLTASVPSPPAA